MFGVSARVLAVFAFWGLALFVASQLGLPVTGAEPLACAGAGATLVAWGVGSAKVRARQGERVAAPAGLVERPARATV